MSDEKAPPPKPVPTIAIGGLRVTGAAAVAVPLVLLGGIVALIVWQAPRLRFTPLVASGLLWLAFIVYWSIAAAGAAKATRSESGASRALHTHLLNLGLLLLFVPVPGLVSRWMPGGTWPIAAGFALQISSGLLAVWARRHLGRNWSGEIARKEGHELVCTGPYRRLRHPIYTAMLGMYFASAMISGETHGLLAFAIVGFAYARKIPLEEAALRAEFGERWAAYRARSWALVPGLY